MTEKSRAGCLQIIGDISIQWSKVEDELKAILWYYVGTDKQVFDVLFGRSRGRDIEDILKTIAKIKEPVMAALMDIEAAVERVGILRRNRNIILHKMRHSHVDDIEGMHPKLLTALVGFEETYAALKHCRGKISTFIMHREGLETPDGDEFWPAEEQTELFYVTTVWPQKPKILSLEE